MGLSYELWTTLTRLDFTKFKRLHCSSHLLLAHQKRFSRHCRVLLLVI